MQKHSMATRFALVGTAFALSLLGACSGGVGGDNGNTGDDEGPLKFGLLAPFSGSESAFGDYMKNGATLAINEINAAGGVNGRTIELLTEDDSCDAEKATAAANKLISQGIIASVGGYCSGATLPTEQIFYDAGIPMVIAAANSMSLLAAGLNSVFVVNGTAVQQATAAVKFAQSKDAQAIVVIDEQDDYSSNLAEMFTEQAKAAGLTIVGSGLHAAKGEKDFANLATAIQSASADFVYYTGYYQVGSLVNRQAKEAGYEGVFLVGDGAVDGSFAELTGAGNIDNVFGTFTKTPDMLTDAQGRQWLDDYRAEFGTEPGPYTMQAYDAARVMAEGIKLAGSTDRDAVAEAIHNLSGFELFSGPAKFTAQGTLENSNFVIVQLKDNAFVLYDDLQG
jgi:branched-chain amino acid transport system substrate-binding protein